MSVPDIPDSLEAVILSRVREITSEDVTICDINPMKDDVDRFGRSFTARERLRGILEGRLRGLRLHSPPDHALERELESSLAALAAMTPEEKLYSWAAKAATGYFVAYPRCDGAFPSVPATLITTD
jgi:hypothetical protein